ncbi:hypothetical protein N7452_009579 [Penicillium brevicompactum]|uniref:LysM domain-containing protein n=1 Tax=Penicillium brevicompactum TaxID=5074 RepID=A0A9W9Q8N3_PENBR|nr:hypothetical protein N7452_009579 [Penicillium brevicompactum]
MVCIRSFCILGLASLGTASAIARDVIRENIDILARQTQESTPPAKEAYCLQNYSISIGDTCWDIIARFNNQFTIAELLCWNSEINPSCSNLIPGRNLCVAVGASAPQC